jgi:hypothetical protein
MPALKFSNPVQIFIEVESSDLPRLPLKLSLGLHDASFVGMGILKPSHLICPLGLRPAKLHERSAEQRWLSRCTKSFVFRSAVIAIIVLFDSGMGSATIARKPSNLERN